MWRTVLRGARALVYVGLLGLIFSLVAYFAFSQFVRRSVTATPELRGLTEEDARARLADQSLRVEWSDIVRYDEEIPYGHVVAQKPKSNTLVKRGSEVEVIVSRGPRRIEVPPVLDTALQAAQVTLGAAGLAVGRTLDVFSADKPEGTVIAQHPAAGKLTAPNGRVDLFLAKKSNARSFLMPDLVRHDYDRVRRFFTDRGFRFGRIGYLSYPGVEPGTVVRQFPIAGHPLHQGDIIALGVVAAETPLP